MNYQRIYNQIVERAKNRQIEGYVEKHHIIPKCLGGSDAKENLVQLTAREHFICHQLLVEIYPNNIKLWYALFLMAIGKRKLKENQYIISSRTYEKIRIEWKCKVKGKPKPSGFMDNELKKKISEANKGVSRNKGNKFSEEVKSRMSQAKKGKPLTKEHTYNLKIGIKNRKKWIKSSRQVEQYDLEDNFIRFYNSAKEADLIFGGKGNNVADCCRGRQKSAYGFKWKYKEII